MKYNLHYGVERAKRHLDKTVTALIFAVTSIGTLIAIPLAANAASNTVVVTPAHMQGWTFFDDNGNGGSGQLVSGPATPPLGNGSAQLDLTAANQGYAFGYGGYSGLRLGDLTSLSYSTYVQQGNNTVAPALQLDIDTDLTNAHVGWQGRLVYEPYYTHTVTDGTWQTWDTMDNAHIGNVGNWWFSNAGAAATSTCTQAKPCTWEQVLAVYPNIGINTDYPGILFKAGSNWAVPFSGNVDALVVGTNADMTTYDFELTNEPTDRAACMNGGYETVTDENGNSFKNQGQCVAWVNHHDGVGQDDNRAH